MTTKRAILAFGLGLFLPTACAAPGPETRSETFPPRVRRWEFARRIMGVDFRIVLCTREESLAREAAERAFLEVCRVDQACSDWRRDSEIMVLQERYRPGVPIGISPLLGEVLDLAVGVARDTEGAFDPTLGPLTLLWRRCLRTRRLPKPAALERALKSSGFRNLELDSALRRATLKRAGMRIDLGGIAKGYAVDRALSVLRRRGFSRALVDGSGDLAVGDPPPGRVAWRIDLDASISPPASSRTLLLRNAAVATSGDRYQRVTLEGRTFAHILDPRTGLGLERAFTATVIAPSCTLADAWATALSVLGPDGLRRIEGRPGFAGILREGRGKALRVRETRNFCLFLRPPRRPRGAHPAVSPRADPL